MESEGKRSEGKRRLVISSERGGRNQSPLLTEGLAGIASCSLQLLVFSLGFDQNRNIRVGVIPERSAILMRGKSLTCRESFS